MPFVHVEQAGGRVVGSTRYGNYAPEHARVEIGWTWIAGPWQRTAVNTEAKRLMFAHAFEVLGAGRVELKADALNERSRAAMHRLGAVEEGVLRRHMATASGRVRDTVYFSVLADEWPAVRAAWTRDWRSRRPPSRRHDRPPQRIPNRIDGIRAAGQIARSLPKETAHWDRRPAAVSGPSWCSASSAVPAPCPCFPPLRRPTARARSAPSAPARGPWWSRWPAATRRRAASARSASVRAPA
jgi:hypothetical protein